jgi:hypothetical protein
MCLQAAELRIYAGICGWTLARAHARSGDPVAIAAYLGKDDEFDRSIDPCHRQVPDLAGVAVGPSHRPEVPPAT